MTQQNHKPPCIREPGPPGGWVNVLCCVCSSPPVRLSTVYRKQKEDSNLSFHFKVIRETFERVSLDTRTEDRNVNF